VDGLTYEDWMSEIKTEDLPSSYQEMVELIGFEATIKLADKYQGTGFYFHKLDTAIQEARNKRIKAEFTGGNHKELARKYRLSEVWIRQILADQGVDENQMTLFDAM
jgi:Mor family transcriptional regulator